MEKEKFKMCDVLLCFSKAVCKTHERKGQHTKHYCIECGVKITKQSGPGDLVSLPDAVFPWDAIPDMRCGSCGVPITVFLIGNTGDCPKCRKTLPGKEYQGAIKFSEGEGHD